MLPPKYDSRIRQDVVFFPGFLWPLAIETSGIFMVVDWACLDSSSDYSPSDHLLLPIDEFPSEGSSLSLTHL